jgi:retron-type reverse transcriptase
LIYDRIIQTLFVLVYEPVIEPYSDMYSFGYRSGRNVHQALGTLTSILSG